MESGWCSKEIHYAPLPTFAFWFLKNYSYNKTKAKKERIGLSTLPLHSLLQLCICILDIGHHPPTPPNPARSQSIQSTIVSGLINNRNVSDLKVENPKSRGQHGQALVRTLFLFPAGTFSLCAHSGECCVGALGVSFIKTLISFMRLEPSSPNNGPTS